MTGEFDYKRHHIVTVEKDGPHKGQHVHSSLEDFINEMREFLTDQTSHQQPPKTDDAPSKDVTIVEREVIPTRAITSFEDRLSKLEQRPITVPAPVNDEVAIPRAIGDLHRQIEEIEKRLEQSAENLPAEITQQDIDDLAQNISDVGRASLMQMAVMVKRMDAIESRVSNLPSELIVEIGRAQQEMKRA